MGWGPLPGKAGPDPRPLRVGLDRVVRTLGAPSVAGLTSLFESWPEVVGEVVAQHVTPLRLDRGTLYLGVDDPAWITELRWLESDLLVRLADVVGQGVVEAIDARVRPR